MLHQTISAYLHDNLSATLMTDNMKDDIMEAFQSRLLITESKMKRLLFIKVIDGK